MFLNEGAVLAILFLRGIGVVGETRARPASLPDSRSEATLVHVHALSSAKNVADEPPEKAHQSQKDISNNSQKSALDGKQMLQTFQIQTYVDANGKQRWSIVQEKLQN